ncbi:MAG: AMP-binding protein [Myxococcales bacterium]|nr:AMP-binding protein [Myxococcales bacterium]
MYIGDWMARGARYWPDNVAVVDRGERFSYAQMNRRADDLAAWLRGAGVGPRDRVALLAMNGVEALDLLFACAKLGAIFVPLNWRSHWRELAGVVALTGPKVLVYGDEFAEAARELHAAAPELRVWLHLGAALVPGSVAYAQALAGAGAPVSHDGVDAEDIVCLLFTGGTTGTPKAAQISYRMIAWNTLNTLVHEVQRGDVTLTHTPMFHTGGLFVYTLPLLTVGGTVVIMRKWTAEEMLALIERERVTLLFCVPTQYQMMLDAPAFATTSFKSVRFLTSGGAPLPVPIIHAYKAAHGVAFKQGFGMTEFGPGIFSMPPGQAEAKAGSIGQPNYFIAAKVVDEAGAAVPVGAVGELVLKGPAACSGYFADAAATAAAFDADGWFHTGDLARSDADGYFFIVDRKKDMFISGGENVYPVEIEAVLYTHPAVAQCAVVPLPDPQWGEVGRAVVALRPGASATPEELLAHCRAHLARYKLPKLIELRDSLPLSPAGKLLKRAL